MLADRVRKTSNYQQPEPEYILATDDDFSGATLAQFRYIGAHKYVEIPHVIKGVSVTRYDNMFQGRSVSGVASTNQNVTIMSDMFNSSNATRLDLSLLDTSSVMNMSGMFRGAQLTSLDLSSFDTSKVTNMSNMFQNSLLTRLDLSSFDTSSVKVMASMFRGSQATIGYARTQTDADKFNSSADKPAGLTFIAKYVLATDDDFSGTSDGQFKYIGTDESIIIIPHVIKGINVTSYNGMFQGTSVKGAVSTNENVTNMRYMFWNSQATSLDLSGLDTSSVTDMDTMFQNSQATSLDLSSFDTSSLTTMEYMFQNSNAASLDLSSFNTSSVTNMSGMFFELQATSLDLSSFDTSSVSNMSYMFYDSNATSLDLSSFDTSSVTDVYDMFYDAQATTGYARTQADADKFNSSFGKPSGLTFIVKP